MKKRLLGGAIVVLVLILSIINSTIFNIAMTVLALLGLKELIDIKYKNNDKIKFIKIISYVLLCILMLNNMLFKLNILSIVSLILLTLFIPILLYNNEHKYNILDSMYFICSILLLGIAFSNISSVREVSIYKVIYIFIISFMTDTYAYIGGSLIGRHRFTKISPKKTIEGCLTGIIIGTFISSMLYYNLIGNISIIYIIIMSLILSVLSEVGDLFFSSIKRYFDKKDYSNLIPGHGGILDRFDSVIFVSLGMLLILNVIGG